MEQVVEKPVLTPKTIVAPEGLNAQQIHGQYLPDNTFMSRANGVSCLLLPEQAGMFEQTRVHLFQRAK